jgi:hypothetical protein
MPEASTLSFVADLVIRRTIAEAKPGCDVRKLVDDAYPFDESVTARRIWLDALIRYSLETRTKPSDRTAA